MDVSESTVALLVTAEARTVSAASLAAEDNTNWLIKSSLWKEDVHENGHHSSWGSWYDINTNRWGYACCHCIDRTEPCSNPRHGVTSQKKRHHRSVGDEQVFDWSNPPTALLPREKVMLTAELLSWNKDASGYQGAFIAHFIRYIVGAWHRLLEGGLPIGEEDFPKEIADAFKGSFSLDETKAGVVPLMRQLQKNEADDKIVKQLDKMVALASAREYSEAGKVYLDVTMGHKKWNNNYLQFCGSAQQNKGARCYMVRQDAPNKYDTDPVTEKFMQAVRRLVRFAEVIRPSSDPTKRFPI